MPLGNLFRRRSSDAGNCPGCGGPLPPGAGFCPGCGIRVDEPDAQPLYIVDRTTGLFNERFIRPVLEDELSRAHRYRRPLGVVLIEPIPDGRASGLEADEEALRMMGAAVAATLREVDTPGVLSQHPPALLAVLPETDVAGTAHAANRVLEAINASLATRGRRAAVGIVWIHPGQRLKADVVIEAASRSLRTGRPELLGR
ncbi:MAG TPA: hypothetical protein VFD01_11745 [Candidatus Dormibacteraeota bacterium]|jgi:PleD family two-component response regulator|nr:hypothetical protein [Candidatus Dormibacteraeota bacterium]